MKTAVTSAKGPLGQPAQLDLSNLLTVEEAADVLSLSVSTLNKMRCKGNGPRFCKLTSRAIRYLREDLNDFIATRLLISTSQAA